MKDRTIAVDLAKNVFEVGISDRPGHVEKRYRLSRAKFLKCFVDQSPSRVVMEACGSSHYWAREIGKLGHEVILISPQYVRPYRAAEQDRPHGCEGVARGDPQQRHPAGSGQDGGAATADRPAPDSVGLDGDTNRTNQHGSGAAPRVWFHHSSGGTASS